MIIFLLQITAVLVLYAVAAVLLVAYHLARFSWIALRETLLALRQIVFDTYHYLR